MVVTEMRSKTPAKRAPSSKPPQPPINDYTKKRRRLDWSKRETCIRCSKGGTDDNLLLFCTEKDCPIATHSRCLHADPSFDEDDGQFYCPFCCYKRKLAIVNVLREESRLARMALFQFIDSVNITKEIEGGKKRKAKGEVQIVRFGSEKRKRLHWTAEEEDMLKEGVQKFSTSANKNLPWRKVLDFGRHVFDATRTPSDLKDKWRNMTDK